jgi:hypothetical protein
MAALAAAGLLSITAAQANTATYSLTLDHCTGGCFDGTSPFAKVKVEEISADLKFTVTLQGSYVFQQSTGLDAFVFGVSGGSTSDITGWSSGFAVDQNPPVHEDGFGNFLFGLTKDDTGGQSLTFTFKNATLADLVMSTPSGNGNGNDLVLFAADIVGNGNTGAVGGSTLLPPEGPPDVPIPGAALLMGSALAGGLGFGGGIGAWRRRRRKAA